MEKNCWPRDMDGAATRGMAASTKTAAITRARRIMGSFPATLNLAWFLDDNPRSAELVWQDRLEKLPHIRRRRPISGEVAAHPRIALRPNGDPLHCRDAPWGVSFSGGACGIARIPGKEWRRRRRRPTGRLYSGVGGMARRQSQLLRGVRGPYRRAAGAAASPPLFANPVTMYVPERWSFFSLMMFLRSASSSSSEKVL